MKNNRSLLSLLRSLLICGLLQITLFTSVHAAGDLTKIQIGFNQIVIEVDVNPNLASSAVNKQYEFDNSSSYTEVYHVEGNGIIPTDVSLDGISVKSKSLVQDPNYPFKDIFTWIKGEIRPDGIITLRMRVPKESDLERLIVDIRYNNSEGVSQNDRYYSKSDHLVSSVFTKQLGWSSGAITSRNQKETEFVINLNLSGNNPINVQTATQAASKKTGAPHSSSSPRWPTIPRPWMSSLTAS